MKHRIRTVADRAKLNPRHGPYYEVLSHGRALGFRKTTADAAGAWIGRWRDEQAFKHVIKSWGPLDRLPASKRYDTAARLTNEWCDRLDGGGTVEDVTVAEACNAYADDLEDGGRAEAAREARSRFKRYVLGEPIARIKLAKLAPRHVASWRKWLAKTPTSRGSRRTDATLNRDLVALRSALNFAHRKLWIQNDVAWRNELTPIEKADRRREVYLTRDERRRLISAAGYDLADFIRVLCLLPLRPGAVAQLKVADYDARIGMLTISHDKAHGGRTVALPDNLRVLFNEAARDKLPTAYLFTRYDGIEWNRERWKLPVRRAVRQAGLDRQITLYALRHSAITDMVEAGVDLATVATLSGTSLKMIQDHYHHLQADAARNALKGLAL